MIFDEKMPFELIGRKLVHFVRTCNLISLFFSGDGELRINVQSTMRTVRDDCVIACTNQMYQSIDDDSNFDWTADKTVFDEAMNHFIASNAQSIVEFVKLEDCGDLNITFKNKDRLEILADSSIDCELWRMFYTDHTGSFMHLVRSPSKLYMEE